MEEQYKEIAFRSLPMKILGRVSFLLNPPCSGKDWRALAGELELSLEDVSNVETAGDNTMELVKQWEVKTNMKLSVSNMLACLKTINRDDVIQDLCDFIKNNNFYNNNTLVSYSKTIPAEYTMLQNYDVFLSYAKQDIAFAKLIVSKLEFSKFRFKVCIDIRDILPGQNKLEQMCKIIENKCHKVIVILSNSFNKCDDCDFQAKIALSLSPGAKKHKVIPILYEHCNPHFLLKHLTFLDYTDSIAAPYFWEKLVKSILMR